MHKRTDAPGLSVEDVARETHQAPGTVRYFGLNPAANGTVTLLNAALKFPDGYLHRVIGGAAAKAVALPDSVYMWLARIGRKLDTLLAKLD